MRAAWRQQLKFTVGSAKLREVKGWDQWRSLPSSCDITRSDVINGFIRQRKYHLHQLVVPEIAHDVDVGALGKQGAIEALNGERCREEKVQITMI